MLQRLISRFSSPHFWALAAIPILLVLSFFYYQRIAAFGCFDDCFNFGAGYFITKGKLLYTEIPFNHQPIMAYASALIQLVVKPDSLYQFLLAHRLFILGISFVSSIFLIYRFGLPAFAAVILYESTKFYVFGDRFLAEAIIPYALIFLLGLGLLKLQNQSLTLLDYIISAFCAWFIIFSREPFLLIGLFLYGAILLGKFKKSHIISVAIFTILSAGMIFYHKVSDYFYNVFTINASGVLANEASSSKLFGIGGIKVFFYPFYVLISSNHTFFYSILFVLSLTFLLLFFYGIYKKKFLVSLFIIISLALTNIRYTEPGTSFYEAFHQAPWYALFIFTIFWMGNSFSAKTKNIYLPIFFWILSVGIVVYSLFSPRAFIHERINRNYEFTTNYAHYYASSEVIRSLSDPKDTLFVDGFDELIHWEADMPSPYTYNWYTSFMPFVPRMAEERIHMFAKNPPDFYYGSCPKETLAFRFMPEAVKKEYVNILFNNKPTCIFVHSSKIPGITTSKKEAISKLGYSF